MYRSDVLHDGELEFITVFPEQLLEVLPFVKRSDDAPDGVSFFQKGVYDVYSEEPVCAGDENLISWSDSRHDLRSVRF